MIIYQNVRRFNRRTGIQEGGDRIWKETRCDFSGRIVAMAEDENIRAYYYKMNVNHGDEDSCYGACGDEFAFGKEHGIDMHVFLSEPFVVYDDAGAGSDTGETEMPAFMKALAQYEDFDQALRSIRMETLKKLLSLGTIKTSDLGSK